MLCLNSSVAHRITRPDGDGEWRDDDAAAPLYLYPEAIHGRSGKQHLKDHGRTHSRGHVGYRVTVGDVLQVGESSLYPALQRLLLRGWVKAEWGASENNRRARYYTLTPAGRKQLAVERQEFDRLILAIHKVLNTA